MTAQRVLLLIGLTLLIGANARAGVIVLDGHPVALVKAQSWCTAPVGTPPNWDAPASPECKMVWRELARRDGRILYSARYAWPSPRSGDGRSRVMTEVVFDGAPGSRIVRRLYALQEDEAQIQLSPLTAVEVGGRTILESRICMSGTSECASDFAVWNGSGIVRIEDRTVSEIRSNLPAGYDLTTNPRIDLASLSGRATASRPGDADGRPSAELAFSLRLDGAELHIADVQIRRRGN